MSRKGASHHETYINPLTGELIFSNLSEGFFANDGNEYTYDDSWRTSNASDVNVAVGYMLKHGWTGSDADKKALREYLNANGREEAYNAFRAEGDEIIQDAITFLKANDVNINTLNDYYASGGKYYETTEEYKSNAQTPEAQQQAFNDYYNDWYSLEDGTTGADTLARLTEAEERAALSNISLAEANYQQAVMDQAAVVKSITDQVKSERMAKLRAGMNESQIANQDMQLMLNNMNALSNNMNQMNQQRMLGQQQYTLAQDTAYQQYLDAAAQGSQTGAAHMAADAGSANQQALNYMRMNPGTSYSKAYSIVTGQNNKS